MSHKLELRETQRILWMADKTQTHLETIRLKRRWYGMRKQSRITGGHDRGPRTTVLRKR
ncbi:protein of unknown function [Acidithiobacillus ferrivorans]|uniref:Uncharacterized protein n=1 Tax=Acidithiobacillus ferrivorans TaxID=160808 RepID=A0A060UPL0_9PROT|nr:hypothetical protein AFERRI_400308 [Acidithiobacillus ferrivorans]SMH64557.1 protein of unknown function [Acidithiobacillus ferrivorans]